MDHIHSLASLTTEFRHLLKLIDDEIPILCSSKLPTIGRCDKQIQKKTLEDLATIVEDILELCDSPDNKFHDSLKKAISLRICGSHAEKEFKNLKHNILSTTYNSAEMKRDNKNLSVPSLKEVFEDSDYHCDDDEDVFNDEATTSTARKERAANSRSSSQFVTPRKTPKSISTDSGISMSFDSSKNGYTGKLERYGDGSESPLAEKGLREASAKVQIRSRPATTPIQPISLPFRVFQPFKDPYAEIKKAIRTSMKKRNVEYSREGMIYCFKLPDVDYLKVGFVGVRSPGAVGNKLKELTDISPELRTKEQKLLIRKLFEEIIEKRRKEHGNCGWRDLQYLMKLHVPLVQRLETILHRHLQSGRFIETFPDPNLSSRRCNHESHREWFNYTLTEIRYAAEAWMHWMHMEPYINVAGDLELSPEWEKRLEDIPNRIGRDNVLWWLCDHLPNIPKSIRKFALYDSVVGEKSLDDSAAEDDVAVSEGDSSSEDDTASGYVTASEGDSASEDDNASEDGIASKDDSASENGGASENDITAKGGDESEEDDKSNEQDDLYEDSYSEEDYESQEEEDLEGSDELEGSEDSEWDD